MKPSERAVRSRPVSPASIARRAAAMRSTASENSTRRGRRHAGGIFDRESGDARLVRARDVRGHLRRIDGETAFEIGADRHVHAAGDRSEVRERFVQRHSIVRAPHRPGESGAGRRQRRESQARERACAARVPRIRDHETAGLVELVKNATAVAHRCHRGSVTAPISRPCSQPTTFFHPVDSMAARVGSGAARAGSTRDSCRRTAPPASGSSTSGIWTPLAHRKISGPARRAATTAGAAPR